MDVLKKRRLDMYYVVTFVVGLVIGAAACWIYKDKAIKELRSAADKANKAINL